MLPTLNEELYSSETKVQQLSLSESTVCARDSRGVRFDGSVSSLVFDVTIRAIRIDQ